MTPIARVVDGKPELDHKTMPHGVYVASTVTGEVYGPLASIEEAQELMKKPKTD
mgnify:CR=1 FL=1